MNVKPRDLLLTGTLIGLVAAASIVLTVRGVNAAGNVQTMAKPKVQTVASAAAAALTTNAAAGVTPAMVCVDNEDGTNFIRVGTDNTVSATANGTKILAGQSKCFPGAQIFWAKASTADCSVAVTPFGAGL